MILILLDILYVFDFIVFFVRRWLFVSACQQAGSVAISYGLEAGFSG